MLHFTDKETNNTYGYVSVIEAEEFFPRPNDLVLMTPEVFEEFRSNRPLGGKWTVEGWVVDAVLLKEELDREETEALEDVKSEVAVLTIRIQEHIVMGETDEARELILRKRVLEELIKDKEV